MNQALEMLFGEGPEISAGQMVIRAVVVFVITLALIRLSGRRSFGQHTPFDSCTTVLLGAILSRAVTGASPFVATIAAATVLVGMHRAVAFASLKWTWFEHLVSGRELEILRSGQPDKAMMKRALITDDDLREAIRQKTGNESILEIRRAVLERDGKITIIPVELK